MINQASRRKERFTQIANSCLRDNRISWRAKGLMAYFMSHDEKWIFRESKIIKDSTDKRDSVRSGLKELIKFGYLLKVSQTRENGKFSHIEYYIDDEIEYSEESQENDLSTVDGKTVNGKTDDGKSPTKNKKIKNTNCKKKEEKEKEKKEKEQIDKRLDFEFLKFISSIREYLKPKADNHCPTLPTAKYGKIGINGKNRLYNKDTQKELESYEAMDIFNIAYQNRAMRDFIYKYKS